MKPIDLSKFKKDIKNLDKVSLGFHDPKYWVSTGSFALNYMISGHFDKGIPMGKVSLFAGQSGSGKSYLVSGNIARNAQKEGYFVVMIDSENALDESWLHALGVSTDEDKLLKMNVAMIDDVAKLINDFVKSFKGEWGGTPRDERPKVLFIIDSLGMLLTPTDVNQFEEGNMKGDMGRKPKALAALVRNCVNTFGEWDMGMVATQHSYASQDMFDPDDKITGGQGFIYASSIVLAMRKLKLKEDADGNKISSVAGIRSQIKCMKTRYNKPFEQCELKIPYDTGLDPYSGLIDFFEAKGYFVKDGNRLRYTDISGTDHKNFRKQITNELLDQMMAEFPVWEQKKEAEAAAARIAEAAALAAEEAGDVAEEINPLDD